MLLPYQFASEGEQHNYEANIASTMANYHELSRGLDVNVRYSGYVPIAMRPIQDLRLRIHSNPPNMPISSLFRVFGFEFTVQSAVFDLVRVTLCHVRLLLPIP